MNTNPLLPKSTRHISAGYQTVIVAGLIILFLQLYSLAKSLFDNNMLHQRIETFRVEKEDRDQAIKAKQLEYFASLLKGQQITELKKTKGLVFLDEEEHRLQNSSYLAHKELIVPSEDPVFKDKTDSKPIPTVLESQKIEALSKQAPFAQWMYMLFHLE